MKVLLINNFFFHKGGSEAVFFNTAELLQKAGHEVVYFSFRREENLPCKDEKFFAKREGPLKHSINYFSNTEAARKLDALLISEKPNIAHVHLFWGGLSPSIFAVLHKHDVPIVHTVHDYRMVCPAYTFRNGRGEICEKCKNGHFIQCFKNRCSKGSLVQSILMTAEMYYRNKKWHPAKELDGIIYVSKFSKQKHEELDARFVNTKNMVLYNCTSVGEQYPPVEKDGGYYLFYGRLSHEKGVATLVDAFAKHPELKLKVVGTGPKEEELKQKGCANIEFLGYKSGDELFNLVRNARFVCVPSEWYENNPMTIVEAYSMGVPVIGARIGGIPEIVEEGTTGFLFQNGNIESLEKVIARSLEVNKEGYSIMKKAAIRFAEVYFDRNEYTDKLLSFYNYVLKKS